MCDSHRQCNCTINSSNPSVQQTLDELDFSRGIWSAALDGSVADVLDFLDKKGVHPDAKDSSGYTALHYASRNGHLAVCQLLLSRRASANIQTTSGGVTPLHRAAYCGHYDIVCELLSIDANPLVKDADGKLALHKAAEKGHASIIEKLLKAEPDSAHVVDNRGRKPRDCVPEGNPSLKMLFDSS